MAEMILLLLPVVRQPRSYYKGRVRCAELPVTVVDLDGSVPSSRPHCRKETWPIYT